MSHHTIIIRGGEYSEEIPPTQGKAAAEAYYTPSDGLTPQQIGQNTARIVKLLDKIYNIESEPEE